MLENLIELLRHLFGCSKSSSSIYIDLKPGVMQTIALISNIRVLIFVRFSIELLRTRANLILKLKNEISGVLIITSSAAETGISAKFEEGSADLIVIYNSGQFRMAGRR